MKDMILFGAFISIFISVYCLLTAGKHLPNGVSPSAMLYSLKRKVATAGFIVAFLLVGFFVFNASASVPRAYRIIGAEYGVPPEVFFSVALQESGRTINGKFIAWPWTLNIDEEAFYFDSRGEAESALIEAHKKRQRVAIGLGQIYWPSHYKRFSGAPVLLNPSINLRYAAKLLSGEYRYTVKKGKASWWIAVGRYHSPSRPDLAAIYRQLVYQRCLSFSDNCERYGRREL